ncbi:MAG: hypothetical protein QOD66_3381, partial [Solirubrobacteraceae bacterium]|nr:hypothetical protein [Solirubrobacteraceae bacterium]
MRSRSLSALTVLVLGVTGLLAGTAAARIRPLVSDWQYLGASGTPPSQ